MDDFEALARSGRTWDRHLRPVTPSRYDGPASVPGWSVFDLVNHVVGGAVRYVLLLRGVDRARVEATREADHIGEDPLRASRDRSATLDSAFARPGALGRTVAHRSGTRSGLVLLRMRVLEQTLHAWDLARTIAADDDRLDQQLCDYLLEHTTPLLAEFRALGTYAPAAAPPAEPESPQQRLLRLSGRHGD